MQHVLPGLLGRRGHGHGRGRALLAVPGAARAPRPPHHPDPALLLPRRHPRLGHPALHGHRRRADLRHQQRPRRLPQRAAAAAEAGWRQGRVVVVGLRQPLRGLRPQPPRQLPLLLPRLQGRRLLPRRRQGQELAPPGRRRRRFHHILLGPAQRRQEAELHAAHAAADPADEAPQGHPAPRPVRQPHRRVLESPSPPAIAVHVRCFCIGSWHYTRAVEWKYSSNDGMESHSEPVNPDYRQANRLATTWVAWPAFLCHGTSVGGCLSRWMPFARWLRFPERGGRRKEGGWIGSDIGGRIKTSFSSLFTRYMFLSV
uniref:Uncharacterized protein n=1 Tax=Zea mays TaxID=4577 RepID=A0A804R3G7_MAIZE